jgi:hypothetical protein
MAWLVPGSICVLVAVSVLLTRLDAGVRHVDAANAKALIDHRVSALLAGIPQHGNTLGSPLAPITLQVFGDLECVDVKYWFASQLPAIIKDFVRPNILRVEYRAMKTDTLDPAVFSIQQTAALAAGAQDVMWNFLATFYQEQGQEYTTYVREPYLDDIAEQVPGLDIGIWDKDRVRSLAERVALDNSAARRIGFHDTPAFRIGRTGGKAKTFSGRYVIVYKKFEFHPGANGKTLITPVRNAYAHPLAIVDARDIKEVIDRL